MFGLGPRRDPSKKLVLHIEDERDIRKMIALSLETLGVETMGADDGPEGIKIAKREKPDLILLDVRMPTLDGFETCAELRKVPALAKTPILMLTALSQMKDVERAMAQGADGYLLKPIEVPKLRQKVAQALGLPYTPPAPQA
jgi:CheY-like chemotaxis protein